MADQISVPCDIAIPQVFHDGPVDKDPMGSRHYFPGDPRRHIHWRNTTRMGRLMVKEFEDAQDPTLDLLYDTTHVYGEGKDTTLEYAIKLMASAAHYSVRNQGSVRVWGGRAQGEICGDSGHDEMSLSGFLEDLARVEAGEGMSLCRRSAIMGPF